MSVESSMVGVLINELIKQAMVVYDVLEKDTHQSAYTLLGERVNVTIQRKVYVEAAGNILEKGKVKVEQVQSDESHEQDVKVGEEKEEQGEGESEEESIKEKERAYEEEALANIKEEEQIAEWWNNVRYFCGWSSCVAGGKWCDILPDGRVEIRKIYFSIKERGKK